MRVGGVFIVRGESTRDIIGRKLGTSRSENDKESDWGKKEKSSEKGRESRHPG